MSDKVVAVDLRAIMAGMHALELAKTVWNLLCTATANLSETQSVAMEKQANLFLHIATSILATLGPEGDEGGL